MKWVLVAWLAGGLLAVSALYGLVEAVRHRNERAVEQTTGQSITPKQAPEKKATPTPTESAEKSAPTSTDR